MAWVKARLLAIGDPRSKVHCSLCRAFRRADAQTQKGRPLGERPFIASTKVNVVDCGVDELLSTRPLA
jgi:hypothetical protein